MFTCIETTDNKSKELSQFQDFLYRNFYNYERCKYMKPDNNQPARIYRRTKTHNFQNLEEMTAANLKFRSLITLERLHTMQ